MSPGGYPYLPGGMSGHYTPPSYGEHAHYGGLYPSPQGYHPADLGESFDLYKGTLH